MARLGIASSTLYLWCERGAGRRALGWPVGGAPRLEQSPASVVEAVLETALKQPRQSPREQCI
jgi:hypothetical protein